MASSRLVLPWALAPRRTRPVGGSSQSRSERFRNPRATRWRSRISRKNGPALLHADLPIDRRAHIAEQIDGVNPDGHGGPSEAQRRELQREGHRVLPLPLDRRKLLVGAAD